MRYPIVRPVARVFSLPEDPMQRSPPRVASPLCSWPAWPPPCSCRRPARKRPTAPGPGGHRAHARNRQDARRRSQGLRRHHHRDLRQGPGGDAGGPDHQEGLQAHGGARAGATAGCSTPPASRSTRPTCPRRPSRKRPSPRSRPASPTTTRSAPRTASRCCAPRPSCPWSWPSASTATPVSSRATCWGR